VIKGCSLVLRFSIWSTGDHEVLRASAIASLLVLSALVGNPIWMEGCVRDSAGASQILPEWYRVVPRGVTSAVVQLDLD
jgi:hypothetical protein